MKKYTITIEVEETKKSGYMSNLVAEVNQEKAEMKIAESTKLQVKASDFLEFMFKDSRDDEAFGRATSDMLKSQGRINITIKDVFNTASYIPTRIMHDYPTPLDGLEYKPEEVEFLDDVTPWTI